MVQGPRLAVLDDGPFVRTHSGELRPVAATFNRFVEAVARTGAFGRVRYIVPVRDLRIWELEPALDPVDEGLLEVVPTTSFSGIADYLLRAAYVATRNWHPIQRAVGASDLVWLRLPASNALLALTAARRHGVAHFGWLAGSVADVVGAQRRLPPLDLAARAVGTAYDAVSALVGRSGPLIPLDANFFASVINAQDVEQTRANMAPIRAGPPWRVVWAGRMAGEKGVHDLIEAFRLLLHGGCDATLVLVGDGPARPDVELRLSTLPPDRVEDYGYVGDRRSYMDLLRSGDLFVHPSQADGVPKVLVEAMAAGLPILAAAAGATREVLADGERGVIMPSTETDVLERQMRGLLSDSELRTRLRTRGLDWASAHTSEDQARRLVDWMRSAFPDLAWVE